MTCSSSTLMRRQLANADCSDDMGPHVNSPSQTAFACATCTTLLQNMMHGLNSRSAMWLIGSSSGHWAFPLHRNSLNTSFAVSVSLQVSYHGKALYVTDNGSLQGHNERVELHGADVGCVYMWTCEKKRYRREPQQHDAFLH